jgi:hypothetical protein
MHFPVKLFLICARYRCELPFEIRELLANRASSLLCLALIAGHGCSGAPDTTVNTNSNSDAKQPMQVMKDISSDQRDVDLGELAHGSIPEHTFIVPNTTDRDFRITKIQKSCGCETAKITEGQVVRSGDVLAIPYILPTQGGGQKSGRLVVETDSSEASFRQLSFTLSATLPRVIWASPEALTFSSSASDHSTQELRIESDIPGLFEKAVEINTCRDLVDIKVKERNHKLIILQITLRPDAPIGDSHDLIRLSMNDPRCSGYIVRVRSIVSEPVSTAAAN